MRLLRDQSGQIRIIEAFFASILILSTIALIPSPPPAANTTSEVLQMKSRNVLMSLDRSGYLSTLIEDGNWTALRKCVMSLLSSAIWYNLTVFDENMNVVNNTPIGSGSVAGGEIVSIEYLCASTDKDYGIYVVRLQLASVT